MWGFGLRTWFPLPEPSLFPAEIGGLEGGAGWSALPPEGGD